MVGLKACLGAPSRYVVRFAIATILLAVSLAPGSVLAAITGQVQGRISDAATGAPLAGVAVVLSAPSGSYRVTTKADGSYSVLGVVPDTYTVAFSLPGYQNSVSAGVTVNADVTETVSISLSKVTRVIGRSVGRSQNSAFQPAQTEVSYNLSGQALQTQLGKAFNVDQKSLLTTLPSVTVDNKGGIFIRGGFAFQVAYQYEGIDYTEPSKSLQDAFSNVGNFDQLSGIASVQIIPGGGDASHGNTGTGLVAFQAKRGTYPGFGLADVEAGNFPYNHQFGFEYGLATPSGAVSNYLTFTGVRKDFQYGPKGAPAAGLGYSYGFDPTTVPGYAASPFATILASAQSTYGAPSSQSSNTLLDNFVYKFGRERRQSVQFFVQNQAVRQALSYGGFANTLFYSGNTVSPVPNGSSTDPIAEIFPLVVPYYPSQTSLVQLTGAPDSITSPFTAYKLEYSNNINDSTFVTARYSRTFNDSIEDQPSQGIYIPQNGGIRTSVALEASKQLGRKHALEVGGKYEYVRPFGSRLYVGNFEAAGAPSYGAFSNAYYVDNMRTPSLIMDFAPPGLTYVGSDAQGNPIQLPVPPGFLNAYFPRGVPRLPGALLAPTTDQQDYALFAQDTITFNDRLRATLGLRLDGYNFLTPDDPLNPPATNGLKHQRLYEPHVGVSERLSARDALRFTYGRTLSIPLASLVSFQLSRAPYAAFAGIPVSGVNGSTCGLNGLSTCKDYADLLYWRQRNFLYPAGSVQFTTPLKGASYTNYDFSYSHDFGKGVAARLTPFYRRGYDIIESSQTVLGYDPLTRLAQLGIPGYTNQGLQKATGVEFLLTKESRFGLSGSLSATYLNQIGNDVPGTALTQTTLSLGDLFRSPNFSPLQATLAASYKSRAGFRINPVVHLEAGYPVGLGAYSSAIIGGKPYNIPATDAFFGYANAYYYTDPENPGTYFNPNVKATRGTQEGASAGSFLSHPSLNTDLTLEYSAPSSRNTFGVAISNLFDQVYGIPVTNPLYRNVIVTGVTGPGNNGQFFAPPQFGSAQPAISGVPGGIPFPGAAGSTEPYIIFPNRAPRSIRFYYQLAL